MALINVPLAGQTLLTTRNPINQNFATINTAFAVNHVEYNIADQGKHKFLQMPEQGAAPATAANEAGLYAAVGATSGVSELVFRRESNGDSIPFTEAVAAQNGWTRLPSGIILQWGLNNIANPTAVNFPIPFPNNCFTVIAQVVGAEAVVPNKIVYIVYDGAGQPNVNGFRGKVYTVGGAGSNSLCYWYAIGN